MIKKNSLFTIYVPTLSFELFKKLSYDEKEKLEMLLVNEFIYLVNCLSSKNGDGLLVGYQTIMSIDKERIKNV